jgi:hypothetical protein
MLGGDAGALGSPRSGSRAPPPGLAVQAGDPHSTADLLHFGQLFLVPQYCLSTGAVHGRVIR